MKIGILTYFRNFNPGAFLQAYELSQVLKKRYPDHEIEVINFQMHREKVFIWNIFKEIVINFSFFEAYGLYKYQRAIRKLSLSSPRIESDKMDELGAYIDRTYDVVIIGSDELWKTDGYRGFPTPFWLDYSFKKCRKCSFSPSSRSNISNMSETDKDIIRKCISELEFVGVRDEKTYRELVKVVPEKEIHIICDPTFLGEYDNDRHKCREKIRKHFKIPSSQKILTAILQNENLFRIIKRHYKDEYFILALSDESDFADGNCLYVDPFEWIEVIAASDFVITQSFHCSVFSMIHSVSFLGIDYSDHGKVAYLLNSSGQSHHLLVGNDWEIEKSIISKMELVKRIDIDGESIVRKERDKAASFWQYMDRLITQNGGIENE